MAEPRNALSSLEFDALVCDDDLSYAHAALSQLAFGSFAMHAAGGYEIPRLLDNVPMQCLFTQFLHALMLKAGHATFAVKGEGKSYAIDALASTCAASLSATLEACDLATMQASLDAQRVALPGLGTSCPFILWGVLRGCYEPSEHEAILEATASSFSGSRYFTLTDDTFDALDAFAEELDLGVLPDAAVCAQAQLMLSSFVEAASYQGKLPGTAEEHHLWHTKSVEGMSRFSGVIKLLPDPALPPGDAPKTAKGGVCTTGDECKSGLCSGSARQRRLLLFASVPGTLFCM